MTKVNKYAALCTLSIGLCRTVGCMAGTNGDGVSDEVMDDQFRAVAA